MWQIINNYIGLFITNIGFIIFCKIILSKNLKISLSKLVFLLVFVSLFHTLIYANIDGIVKNIIILLIDILLCKESFKTSNKKSVFLSFLYMILMIIPELIELFLITKIFRMDLNSFFNQYAGSILGNLTITMFVVLLTYIFKKNFQNLIKAKIENNIKIIIISLLTLTCIGMLFYTLTRAFRLSNDIILYLCAIVVLLIVLYSLIQQTIENNKLTQEYDQLLEFMKTYEIEIENQRILRHETKNEFRTIRAKICDKQKEKEIIEYIDEIVNDKYEVKQEEYAKFGYLPPNGIKGLCYFKTQEAKNKGIEVALNISKRVEQSTIYKLNVKQQREFGKILGVFLDNAIEASAESEKKELGIEAYVNKEQEFKIIISNTFNNKIEKDKIGKESFSTKGKTRGHGLLLVKRITEMNKCFEIKSEINGDIYVQTLVIKKANSSDNND